ncbi:MAG: hypothetical protein J2P15_03835 [Micromonosporaceae bacterium]|nr:hypothetical protein [Micromonosporaceae bacterium]
MTPQQRVRRIRLWLAIVIAGLVVSGVTAFPLEIETRYLARSVAPVAGYLPGLASWLTRVHNGLAETGRRYPFIAYGTDWLAFAHLVLAVAFWGPVRDPVRNVWVVQLGIIACAGVIPLALICGPVRGIPFGWTCVDMSFGVFGVVPLLLAYRHIRVLQVTASLAGAQALPAHRST